MHYFNILAVLIVAMLAVASASPVPDPLFWKKHEHHVIHVPYTVKTVHHHHVQKVPVYKYIKTADWAPSAGWSAGWPSSSLSLGGLSTGWDW